MQPEGHGGPCAMGEQGSAPKSGVYDYGTLEEDGPDTWETLIAPCGTRAKALFMTVWCPDSRSVESNCGIPRG